MDTRLKIAAGAECAPRLAELRRACPGLRVVSGYFDPVLASHAARLDAARADASAVAVVVLDPPDPILPARARAELVAGLAAVSMVLLPEGTLPPHPDIVFEPQDLDERTRFTAHVLERQR